MSVQFWCPDAVRHRVPCPDCERARSEGRITPHGTCFYFCDGWEDRSDAPEFGLATANARSVLELLGFPQPPDHPTGELPAGRLADLRARVVRAMNADWSHLITEARRVPGGQAGTRFIRQGNLVQVVRMGAAEVHIAQTREQWERRLRQLDRLASWAQKHNHRLAWG